MVFPLGAFFMPGIGYNVLGVSLRSRSCYRGSSMGSGWIAVERWGTSAGRRCEQVRGGLVELVTRVTALARILHTHHHCHRQGFSPPFFTRRPWPESTPENNQTHHRSRRASSPRRRWPHYDAHFHHALTPPPSITIRTLRFFSPPSL